MMEEAMVEAKAAGVNEAASYMVESSILKDRGEKQLEAQTMLTQALASLSKSKMRGACVWQCGDGVHDTMRSGSLKSALACLVVFCIRILYACTDCCVRVDLCSRRGYLCWVSVSSAVHLL